MDNLDYIDNMDNKEYIYLYIYIMECAINICKIKYKFHICNTI